MSSRTMNRAVGKARVVSLQRELAEHGGAIQRSLAGVIRSMPVPHQGTRNLSRILGINKSLASRVLTVTKSSDPLSVLVGLPGVVSLRTFLTAAHAAGADSAQINAADAALRDLELTIQTRFLDRAKLDAYLSEHVPDSRSRVEANARHGVYRGMSVIKGVSAEVQYVMHVARDYDAQGEWGYQTVVTDGLFGLRRIRASAPMQFAVRHSNDKARENQRVPLLSESEGGYLAREFCRPAGLEIAGRRIGDMEIFEVVGNEVGLSSAVDVVHMERACALYPPDKRGMRPMVQHHAALIDTPTKRLVFDLLMHSTLVDHYEANLDILDTSMHGFLGNEPGKIRPGDRYPFFETLAEFPGIAPPPESGRIPLYDRMVSTVFRRTGWDPAEFRTYRIEMTYPIHGSQVTIELTMRNKVS